MSKGCIETSLNIDKVFDNASTNIFRYLQQQANKLKDGKDHCSGSHGTMVISSRWPNTNNSAFSLGWGLNVMSAPVQGNIAFTKELRVRANIGPSRSSDKQMQHWAVSIQSPRAVGRLKAKGLFLKEISTRPSIARYCKE
ncbi:unnamed protein product [Aspergillus oryzae]|uniref:Unnamed protein product n=2 Tax=Aspergillus oryzae TaxID=5062 RepID=A0AAN5BUA4_ASPOZ|nr:unnamed protein product [Aspergillus oryzae]GMF84582.1 unnamed protein product [Aspergillus oryzae]GMG26753.1 unnamed protein product [Aspergillus oryzae]GMG47382.1 unnamed protein product [Aspergillus oryzae var. brunneus]